MNPQTALGRLREISHTQGPDDAVEGGLK